MKVIASLDGPREIHNENRITKTGEPTFDLIDKNIRKIKERTNSLSMIAGVYTLPTYNKMDKIELYCGAGITSIFIDELGSVVPCQLFVGDSRYYMGNFFDDTIKLYNDFNKVQDIIIKK